MDMNDLEPYTGYGEDPELPAFVGLKKSLAPPDGYFDQFPGQIMERWNREVSPSTSPRILYRRMWAAAAVVTGLCIGIAIWTAETRHPMGQQAISSNDAMQYIMEHMEDFEPLLLQSASWTEEETSDKQAPDATEEYLLEELQGEDFETIF